MNRILSTLHRAGIFGLLILATITFLGGSAHAQGGRVRVSVHCTTMGTTGQARVDDPHDVTVTVTDGTTEKTVTVPVPKNMTGTAIVEELIEALEDAGVPGATQTSYAASGESEVNQAAKRVLILPDGWKYVSDFVSKEKSKKSRESHLSVEPEKKKSGSGFAPLSIEWIRIRAVEQPGRPIHLSFDLEDSAENSLFEFDQVFESGGVTAGFNALQDALEDTGYPIYRTQSYELFVYTGAASIPVDLVRFGLYTADDPPGSSDVLPDVELREIWKDLLIQ